ncbi:alpha-hydroxy-acid oxidizing enzyme [Aliidongia dinghuensis]|uniref:Alpha-hydroxy-acid oxidizing enzyme n=1 Tax=Aliidongia dinghuensis TaxID=1867774 RepID=A0A8J2Z018_9PROT|nr:alpha-hydroxy acid oxidase [Aliidongia dinghuensis]GGF44339.1 alpha-hydroxy-acid oxidizing enzyme [Aliidongia dinghuensis]
MARLLNTADYREAARRFLPRGLFEYIDRGTEDELALANLRRALDDLYLTPSVLAGHPARELATTVLGQSIGLPMVIAPTALAGLVAHDGEVKLARAAARQRIPFCISTQSVTTIEEVRAGAPDATVWFQLYLWKDRELSYRLLDRVRACGVTTLVVTADTPVGPNREYNKRNGFGVPFSYSTRAVLDVLEHPRWFASVLLRYLATTGMPSYGHYPAEFRNSVTRAQIHRAVALENLLNWDDLSELRRRWPGQILLKGVLAVADAIRAADVGLDGVVVSAHGGRNLDVAPPSADVLPAIAEAVGNRIEVLADSGARRGSDVLKYVALGAKAVMLGRAPLWGLAAGGEAGADGLLAMLRTEIDLAMTFLGIARPEETRGRIVRRVA